MKKLLISLVIILFVISFASCVPEEPSSTQPPEESTPSAESTPAAESTPVAESAPVAESTPVSESMPSDVGNMDFEIQRYSFNSIEDFELYCKTGSKDTSLYKNPPSIFPGYKMKEGAFVNLNEVFPDLDMESITVYYIEVIGPYVYGYSGYTKNGTEFDVVIVYNENATEISADKIIEKRASENEFAMFVKGDYYTSKVTSKDWRVVSIYYIFDMDDYTLEYSADAQGNVYNMWIHHDNYEIGIGSGLESNRKAFFADEVLKPMTDLFSDGEARTEALNKIKQFTESKK